MATFNPEVQRGRFYVDADMLRENNACATGLQEYVDVFGEGRHKFNKSFIRKAIKHQLNLYFLMYYADAKHDTFVYKVYDTLFDAWLANSGWDSYLTDKARADMYIEAFTAEGYI